MGNLPPPPVVPVEGLLGLHEQIDKRPRTLDLNRLCPDSDYALLWPPPQCTSSNYLRVCPLHWKGTLNILFNAVLQFAISCLPMFSRHVSTSQISMRPRNRLLLTAVFGPSHDCVLGTMTNRILWEQQIS
jgi:hypothetical protein